jgi:tetraacyldisaccharide 4'-kinase
VKAPKFWQKKSFISYSLLPLSYLYRLAGFLHYLFTIPKKISKPVVCIGNVVAGGSGKTPIAIKIGEMLQELNYDFAYLSRGYGGSINDFTLVDKKLHSALEVGDEPLLLAEIFSTYIANNRVLAAEKIASMTNKKLIIMDDGLQNPSIIKDFSILVIAL